MSTIAPTEQSEAQTLQASLKGVPPVVPQRAKRGSFVHKARLLTILYALMAPTLIGMILFIFYPQWGAVKFSLYDWDGDIKQEFVGLNNFTEAFTRDAIF